MPLLCTTVLLFCCTTSKYHMILLNVSSRTEYAATTTINTTLLCCKQMNDAVHDAYRVRVEAKVQQTRRRASQKRSIYLAGQDGVFMWIYPSSLRNKDGHGWQKLCEKIHIYFVVAGTHRGVARMRARRMNANGTTALY